MVVRQLETRQYEQFCRCLLEKAQVQPMDPSYTVTVFWKGDEYSLKVLPEENNQIIALQALLVMREEDGPNFILYTGKNILATLLDHLLDENSSH